MRGRVPQMHFFTALQLFDVCALLVCATTILVRDPNRVVAVAVLSSPKITETEIESIAKMANVSDEILRIIGNTRTWTKSYSVVTALVRNAKTPVGVSMTLLHRLMERDVKALSVDRNIPEVLRVAARKKITDSKLNR